MKRNGYPIAQGLYNPDFEHDACGIGMIAQLKGEKSHQVIKHALTILCNMEHRGGQSADQSTGDGAGILTQLPHVFFKELCQKEGIECPPEGEYGVGMLFLPQQKALRAQCEQYIQQVIEEEGQRLVGWRSVPIDSTCAGHMAMQSLPFIRQVLVGKGKQLTREEFERRLYIIRKRLEKEINSKGLNGGESFYFCSFSTKTIVYKGMLSPDQLGSFYCDLQQPSFQSALALVHSRFSTNTFPSWERAHPNRYSIHNGEINTIKGNVNWMRAREKGCVSAYFDQDQLKQLLPIIDRTGSDSSILDNCLEFLHLSGRSLAHTAMMMLPEPWAHLQNMEEDKRAFYEYHSALMEPWDGPAAIVFTDGKQIGACLDRNGLRPARYYVTRDNYIILASEVGVLDIAPEEVVTKERLRPGKMLLIDLEQGKIIPDDELKKQIAQEYPYKFWLEQQQLKLDDLAGKAEVELFRSSGRMTKGQLIQQQIAFGYTTEELNKVLRPMAIEGKEPVGSMGYDAPLAILSKKPQLLYNYFKQLFAQVTNPPLDAIRERIVTSTVTNLGAEGNLVQPTPESCRRIRLETPILTCDQLELLLHQNQPSFKSCRLSLLYSVTEYLGLEAALNKLFIKAEQALSEGASLLILSDRGVSKQKLAIPALLATAGLHHYLIRQGKRTQVSILLESGEPREVHHFAVLLSYGIDAIHPYLAFETIAMLQEQGELESLTYEEASARYVKAVTDGIIKVMSKMGISTIQSYRGAQVFESVGLGNQLIERYFAGTPSRLGGIGLETIHQEVLERHQNAFRGDRGRRLELDTGDQYQWRQRGEDHQYNPQTIHLLQHACRTKNYHLYKRYAEHINEASNNLQSIRGLLRFKKRNNAISLDEVESVEQIVKRFRTGAMSLGAISSEAHEALAIAMNRIGGRSNSGEGGEYPERNTPDKNGDLRRSAIKQVASGRFGVTSYYLANADEIQIKIAQGAKPGEGGQLPGKKVYPWIAELRGSAPGVGLISPPPHHDIYSIEDLAELIYNLKNANPNARISVKLVAAVGVGTIAAGVAKGKADHVLISGYDGGTGAAPLTSIRHTGLPWELGLAETHQTLLLNGLRDRIVVEADGKMMTGRDVVIATLLGAEQYGFSTAPLVVLGCVIMRVCHLDTCPVGIATQNAELRQRFMGKPEHVVNLMHFIATEVREIMAELGFRTIDEMVGRTDVLEVYQEIEHWKARSLNLNSILHQPKHIDQTNTPAKGNEGTKQNHVNELEQTLDFQKLIPLSQSALKNKAPLAATLPISNRNRSVGTMLGYEISKRYGLEGLPEDTIHFSFKGSAGQSFGAFIPKGLTLQLMGDANDYVGKGLSGGKLIIAPPFKTWFQPEENIIIGNVAFYGATSGEAYVSGVAGERFCVRNSGAHVVVEGVGDHGCEYMTGGHVFVLGKTGKNFAAGMSGGIAYVFDEEKQFLASCNQDHVVVQGLMDHDDEQLVLNMIKKHVKYTGSPKGKRILEHWKNNLKHFVRVVPKELQHFNSGIQIKPSQDALHASS